MLRSSLIPALGLLGFLCACSSDNASTEGGGGAGTSGSANQSDASTNQGGASGESNQGGASGDSTLPTGGTTNTDSNDASSDDASNSDASSPTRAIAVSDDRPDETFAFFPEDANPSAVRWYQVQQVARFKRMLNGNVLPVRAKLVIVLNGVGGAAGPSEVADWLANRGFHTLTVDYGNLSSVRLLPDSVPNDGLPGPIEAYSEIIEGIDYSLDVNVPKADSVFGRIDSALSYLSTIDPGADWGYYLNADGSARLSDVIFYGYSFGGATSTVIGKRHNVDRVVAAAAPRYEIDSTGAWLEGPTVTPIDRFYAIIGTQDPDFLAIQATIDALGLPGSYVDTTTVATPYQGSHRLQNNQGHVAMCSGTELDDVCEYAFGIAQ